LASVEKVTGTKAPHTIGPRREGDPPSLVADSTKLQKTLGWRPTRADLDGIVRDAWEFALKESALPDKGGLVRVASGQS